MKYLLNTDGGARGNPGPAAIGIVISDEHKKIIYEIGKSIGEGTNNEAEYTALLEGIKICKEKGADTVECRLDSELVVKQLNGLYKVKNERMLKFWTEIKGLEKYFEKISYVHVPRSENKQADTILNKALDSL